MYMQRRLGVKIDKFRQKRCETSLRQFAGNLSAVKTKTTTMDELTIWRGEIVRQKY